MAQGASYEEALAAEPAACRDDDVSGGDDDDDDDADYSEEEDSADDEEDGAPPRSQAEAWGSTEGLIEADVWEVEALVGKRLGKGKRAEYLVRWKGWAPAYDSWEPAKHVDAALIEEYEASQA